MAKAGAYLVEGSVIWVEGVALAPVVFVGVKTGGSRVGGPKLCV